MVSCASAKLLLLWTGRLAGGEINLGVLPRATIAMAERKPHIAKDPTARYLKQPKRRPLWNLALSLQAHTSRSLFGASNALSGPDIKLIDDFGLEGHRKISFVDVFDQVVSKTRQHSLCIRRSHMMRQSVLRSVYEQFPNLCRRELLRSGGVGHPCTVLVVYIGCRVSQPDLEQNDAERVNVVNAREILFGRITIWVAIERDFEVIDRGSGGLSFLVACVFEFC